MKKACIRNIAFCVGALLLCSCSEEDSSRKATFPVTGEVYVDGTPVADITVRLSNVNGIDKESPTVSGAQTDEEGKFSVSTYETSDGVPEGEYVMTFSWRKFNKLSMSYGGKDKLNNRYSDEKKSKFRIKVENGKPTDMGKIELTTK